jgi:hypothetical protein
MDPRSSDLAGSTRVEIDLRSDYFENRRAWNEILVRLIRKNAEPKEEWSLAGCGVSVAGAGSSERILPKPASFPIMTYTRTAQ